MFGAARVGVTRVGRFQRWNHCFGVVRREFRGTGGLLGKIPFILADIGEGIKECEIMEWFVRPGDEVKQFDKICEVSSDKATVEVTSRFDGKILSLEWEKGDMAEVGKPLVMMDVEGMEDKTSGKTPQQTSPAKERKDDNGEEMKESKAQSSSTMQGNPVVEVAKPSPALETMGSFSVDPVIRPSNANDGLDPGSGMPNLKRNRGDKFLATPAVRRLARDHNLDLSWINPSGKDGRILKGDVLSFIKNVPVEERKRVSQKHRHDEEERKREAKAEQIGSAHSQQSDLGKRKPLEKDEVIPVKGIQRAMVKSMEAALKIPHFNFMEEYDMTKLADFREEVKETAEANGVRLSYMPILIKAASVSLIQFPGLNGHISSDASEVTQKASHNIGVAMDTPRGLLVPVVRNVQEKSIFEIAEDLMRLQELGKTNKLGEDELSGATFTLSNVGTIGGTYASPVIPPPTLVIGAIGKIQTLPRFRDSDNPDDGVSAAKIMNISWAADHRVVDGATIARFSNQLKEYIQRPTALISALK